MARTQAVYYRDRRGVEPVDRFIEALPAKRAAKIDDYVDEHLNGKPAGAPPPEFPITSQIEGELRGQRVKTRRPRAEEGVELLIGLDKLSGMGSNADSHVSPRGARAAEAARGRARRSEEYREARDEYTAIRELRKRNWIAAHIRERRYELELTQQEVAERAGTSHSFISKLESGDHIPTIPVLERILRVLDEQLLIGIERLTPDDEESEREVAPVPEVVTP